MAKLIISNSLFSQSKFSKDFRSYTITPEYTFNSEVNDVYFYWPKCVKYGNNNKIYVSDSQNNRFVILNDDFKYINQFGRRGNGPSEFIKPGGFDFDNQDNIIISDLENQRIQILNKNFEYISGFVNSFCDFKPDIAVDKNNRIFINTPSRDFLFTLLDYNGNIIASFGEKILKKESKHPNDNLVRFDLDEEGNLYCSFLEKPILRKYDNKFKLIYEINLESLPEIKERKKVWEKYTKGRSKGSRLDKVYIASIAADKEYIYLDVFSMEANPIYIIEKNTGFFVRKFFVQLNDELKLCGYRHDIDVSQENIILIIDEKNMTLVKCKK
jgi:hypothetical protein